MPTHWYNILPDLDFELPPDLPPPVRANHTGTVRPQVPMELVRQSMGKRADVSIPEPVLMQYAKYRPTTLFRARGLEEALETPARIYYKHEGGNTSGSHKLNTAIAQAYYYKQAGVRRLVTATGAGQWGTALAAACHMFGLECKVYMVGVSYLQKPYRRTMMNLYGAEVVSSPSTQTSVGRELLANDSNAHGNLALAIGEAIEETQQRDDTRFCIGSGESYSLLHQTIIGLEARKQMDIAGDYPDVVIGSLGAGSNFGGIALPFVRDNIREGRTVRCLSVEPSACPKLTRGEYRYDFTDSSGVTPLEKMYTLGNSFTTPVIHAGGLRYHATSKLISALYSRGMVEAAAYQQRQVFESGTLFCRTEGILPAPESAHAVHGAVVEALRARQDGRDTVILFCLSGHGHFDMTAYEAHMNGGLDDIEITDGQIAHSLSQLPVVTAQ